MDFDDLEIPATPGDGPIGQDMDTEYDPLSAGMNVQSDEEENEMMNSPAAGDVSFDGPASPEADIDRNDDDPASPDGMIANDNASNPESPDSPTPQEIESPIGSPPASPVDGIESPTDAPSSPIGETIDAPASPLNSMEAPASPGDSSAGPTSPPGSGPASPCGPLSPTASPPHSIEIHSPAGSGPISPTGSGPTSPAGSHRSRASSQNVQGSVHGSHSRSVSPAADVSPARSHGSHSPAHPGSGSRVGSPASLRSASGSRSPIWSPARSRSRSGSPFSHRSGIASPAVSRGHSGSPNRSRSGSPTRSRSGSPAQNKSRSVSPARSKSRSVSPAHSRSRSGSPARSRSHSGSPARSRSGSPARSRSRSGSPARSRSRSGSPARSRSHSGSPARSRSRSGSPARSRSRSGSPARSRSGSRDRSRSASPARSHKDGDDDEENIGRRKRKVVSDDEGDGSDKGSAVGELIADIFGSSDEEEEFEGFGNTEASTQPSKEKKKHAVSDDENKVLPDVSDDEDGGVDRKQRDDFVSDFELMLQKKKEEMRKRRKKRKDVDLINDNDDLIADLIQRMRQAAEEDRSLNEAQKPAVKKLQMLPKVMAQLKKADLHNAFLDGGVLNAITDWLAPLPDKSLPHLQIREALLRQLTQFPSISTEGLKMSGIGKAVMYLYKHPKELRQNKDIAGKLINDWSRPIFNLTSNYKNLTREEREQRDYEQLPKKRRISLEGGATPRRDIDKALVGDDKVLRPGDPGYVYRARVPQPSHKDYVIRPKWTVEEKPKSSSKKAPNKFEQHMRAYKRKAQASKMQRAVTMSIEGRNMTI